MSALHETKFSAEHDDLATFNSTWNNKFTRLQDTLLEGKYLDNTKFENLTRDECVSKYNAQLITSGSGFGVPIAPIMEAQIKNNSLMFSVPEGSGNLMDYFGAYGGYAEYQWLDCE